MQIFKKIWISIYKSESFPSYLSLCIFNKKIYKIPL